MPGHVFFTIVVDFGLFRVSDGVVRLVALPLPF